MIKANELRIGNFYFFVSPMKGDKSITELCNWTEALDFEAYGEPIPLTPEILKQFDFKTYEDDEDWKNRKFKNGRFILTLYKNGRCMFCVRARDNVRIADIYFVHQLQNIYFALTGEELPIQF